MDNLVINIARLSFLKNSIISGWLISTTFFVAHRVGSQLFEWIGFGKLNKLIRQIEIQIIDLCRTKLYEQIPINHYSIYYNALNVLWFVKGNVGEIPQKSFEELYL